MQQELTLIHCGAGERPAGATLALVSNRCDLALSRVVQLLGQSDRPELVGPGQGIKGHLKFGWSIAEEA